MELCGSFQTVEPSLITVFCTQVDWPAVSTCRLSHWYVLIYKAILGRLPCYSSFFLKNTACTVLRPQDSSYDCSESSDWVGKKDFLFSAPSTWNSLQNGLKLQDLVTLSEFKCIVKSMESDNLDNCTFFNWKYELFVVALLAKVLHCVWNYTAAFLGQPRDFNLNGTTLVKSACQSKYISTIHFCILFA